MAPNKGEIRIKQHSFEPMYIMVRIRGFFSEMQEIFLSTGIIAHSELAIARWYCIYIILCPWWNKIFIPGDLFKVHDMMNAKMEGPGICLWNMSSLNLDHVCDIVFDIEVLIFKEPKTAIAFADILHFASWNINLNSVVHSPVSHRPGICNNGVCYYYTDCGISISLLNI